MFWLWSGETDCIQEHVLVEIESVKCDVEKEPAKCHTNQLLQMSPLAEVDHERLQLHVSGWWRNVCFDD